MNIQKIAETSMKFILSRFENNSDYPFIDTKFNIATGENFTPLQEDFRQKDFIYGWIQGRGLESLAGHVDFFRDRDPVLAERLQKMCSAVMEKMEKNRLANNGRVFFAMTPSGSSRFPVESECGNFSMLFYSKGLFAAASMLGDKLRMEAAEKLFVEVINDIDSNKFHTDQHGFDPKNPVAFVPGKFSQGARMISLYGLALLGEKSSPRYLDRAAESISFIYDHHINSGQYEQLEKFDFIEAIDADKKAFFDGEKLLCDPGHALEFVGLAAKCLLLMRRNGSHAELLERSETLLPELFRHIFDLGFQKAGGVIKSYDLITRQAVNSDMPWWSLPELIRAGAELITLFPGNAAGISGRIALAAEAFEKGFLRAGSNSFACQTRDAAGNVVDVIPAVPDADPGYHTNLSLIDALALGVG